jgi:hypothetical protein
VTINWKERALDGFMKIQRNFISAVAIVDDDGKLIGTLSASDLRGIDGHRLKLMLLPALDFLKEMGGM